MFEFEENLGTSARIKIVGVGDGGIKAAGAMLAAGIKSADFVAVNTDSTALKSSTAATKIQIGSTLTKGLSAGGDAQIGREAALEETHVLREALSGCDLVFVVAGLGGGTGTGASPVIARIARDVGALTVVITTKPFAFEGRRRQRQAETAIPQLLESADSVIAIANDHLLSVAAVDTPVTEGFRMVDRVLIDAVKTVIDLIANPGLVRLDFADIRAVMKNGGLARMACGTASGQNRAVTAAHSALSSPLWENSSIAGAQGLLLSIHGSSSMTLFEVNEASRLIQEQCSEDAKIIFGTVIDAVMGDSLSVRLIATALDESSAPPSRAVTEKQGATFKGWLNSSAQSTETTLKLEPIPSLSMASSRRSEPADSLPTAPSRELREVFEQQFVTASADGLGLACGPSATLPRTTAQIVANPTAPSDSAEADIASRLLRGTKHELLAPSAGRQPVAKWGEAPRADADSVASNADALGAVLPRQSRETAGESLVPKSYRRKNEDDSAKPEYRKIISDMGLNENEADEYDIPAFMRRAAD